MINLKSFPKRNLAKEMEESENINGFIIFMFVLKYNFN